MKKIFSIFLLVIFLGIMVAPVVMAQPVDKCVVTVEVPGISGCKVGDPVTQATTPDFGMCCFVQTIHKITNWIFYIMTVIAILLFVYGGITFMTSMGNPDGATKGKNILIYAIIGLIVALLAKIVPSIVVSIVR